MAKMPFQAETRPARISRDSLRKLEMIRAEQHQRRERFIPAYREIARYFNPALGDWDETTSDADAAMPDYRNIYDTVGARDSSKLADGIQAYGFNRSTAWIRLATEDQDMMEDSAVREWLQRLEEHLYRQLAQSTFYDEGRSLVRNSVDFATGVMFRSHNVARGLPSYQVLHPKRVLLMEDENGEVDTLFRDLWLSPYVAYGMFGESLPADIKQAYTDGKSRKWPFRQWIFPADKFDLDIDARSTRGMDFYSLYTATRTPEEGLREGGYERRPFFAWRFSRDPEGSPYGVDSPGLMQISNVKQLNGMRQDYHRGIQGRFRPPLKATEGLRGRIDTRPGAPTWLKPGEDYGPAMVYGDTKGLLEDVMLLRADVDESYHTKLFLILSENIQRVKTATEAEGIKGEQAAMLTAFFGRTSTEFLEPTVEDLVQLELDSGRAPAPPPRLRGRLIKVDLVSPLAMLQKRYLLLDGTRQWLSEVVALAQAFEDPAVRDSVDTEEYVRRSAELYNVDRRVVRDMLDVQRMQFARAQRNQQMMEAQMAEQRAQTYKATTAAPQAGSPAAQLMGARA